MKVQDIMSRPVVTVSSRTPLREVAKLLADRHFTGLPVVDDGSVVGVISESDIVRKEHDLDEPRRRFRRRRRSLVEATTAGEAMSLPPITVAPWVSAYGAAWLMAEHDVNRLPVVQRGELVGIVARADLVRAFARSDAEIEREIREEILPSMLLSPLDVEVTVERGEVTLAGVLESGRDVDALPRAVRRVAGVVAVHARLGHRVAEPAGR